MASAFIEMAARLVEMKSYLLLPRSEEGERLKQELTGQLIEYEQCLHGDGRAACGSGAAGTCTVGVRLPGGGGAGTSTYLLRHRRIRWCWQAAGSGPDGA